MRDTPGVEIRDGSLEGRQVRLREFERSDADGLLEVYGDPEVTRLLSFEPYTADRLPGFFDRAEQSRAEVPRTEYALAVADLESNRFIGSARLAVEAHRAGQLGFALAASRWSAGIGTEVVSLLVCLAFEHLELHRVWAARAPDNLASARVLEKNGFVQEGTIRDH